MKMWVTTLILHMINRESVAG